MTSGKRIAYFSAYYPPHMGGVEQYTQQLSRALARNGCEVTVFTSACLGSRPIDRGVSVVEVPSVSLLGDRFPAIVVGPAFMRFMRDIKGRSFDAVVANTRYYPLCMLACRYARCLGVPPFIIDHSSGRLSEEHTALGGILRAYEHMANRVLLNYHPRFLAVSSRSSAWLESLGITTCGIVPNSIDSVAYRNLASRRNFRAELDAQQAMLVVFAGRLIEEKGVLKLAEAVKELAAAGLRMRLVVAGAGPLERTLSAMGGAVNYVGRLDQHDLSALLKQADVFCLPTDYPEGLPTVLLEAAAQQCAIVVSDTGGAKEVVPNGDYGIILRDTSVATIASALSALACSTERMESIQAASAVHVEQSFSWDTSAQALLRAIEEVRYVGEER